jgi:hypothetical protein
MMADAGLALSACKTKFVDADGNVGFVKQAQSGSMVWQKVLPEGKDRSKT